MKKLSKTILTGAGAAAAGMAAVSAAVYASTSYLVKMAMDRQMPEHADPEKRREQLRGFLDCEEFVQQMEEAEQKLKATPHEVVKLCSYDQKNLVGHWFPCENPKRVILAMHGWRSDWASDFGTVAEFWKNCGCSVLYVQQRGQGESDGEYIGFGMTERYDCLEWVKWLNCHGAQDYPIYLAGVSMGATTVLMAAGLPLPDNVRGIMADCGFTSAHAIWKHVAENNLHLKYGLHDAVADSLCRERIQMGTKECSTVEAMEACKIPVLFVHGTDDHFVPVEMTYENYRACIAPKQLLVVPGADHGMSHFVEKARYEQTMQDFWKKIEG